MLFGWLNRLPVLSLLINQDGRADNKWFLQEVGDFRAETLSITPHICLYPVLKDSLHCSVLTDGFPVFSVWVFFGYHLKSKLCFDRVLTPFCFVTESIIAFAWEPNGSKFAVLHGETPRISVSFYHVKNNGKIELISKWLQSSEKCRY